MFRAVRTGTSSLDRPRCTSLKSAVALIFFVMSVDWTSSRERERSHSGWEFGELSSGKWRSSPEVGPRDFAMLT